MARQEGPETPPARGAVRKRPRDFGSYVVPRRGRAIPLLNRPFFWGGILPLAEGALIVVLFGAIFALRSGMTLAEAFTNPPTYGTGLLLALSILCILACIGAYRRQENFRNLSFAAELLLGIAFGALLGLFLLYVVFFGSPSVARESRSSLLLAAVAFAPFSILFRMLLQRPLDRIREQRPFLVIGQPDSLSDFRTSYARTGLCNPLLETELTPGHRLALIQPWDELGQQLEAVILTEPAEMLSAVDSDRLIRMHFEELPVYSEASFYASRWRQVPTLHLAAGWVFDQDFHLAERSPYRFVKRGIDLSFSLLMLLLGFPLLLLVALLVKVDSIGPVFYRQERLGQHRRPFQILKFRTMQVATPVSDDIAGDDADAKGQSARYTAKDDPRVTRVGKWLRRMRIDEVPQIYNVLRGDMSLIGPRPEWTELVSSYEQEIPGYHLRHLVRPGITGWAQLNYRYGANLEDTVQKLRYDLYYIQFYSPVLDLEIILKTILSMLSLRGR